MSKEILPNLSVGKPGIGYKTKDSTRLDLAAHAARFFAKQGYYGTSTQAIAESCKIRKASLFHHYKTKEDIAIAAIDYVHKECVTRIFKPIDNIQISKEQTIVNFLQACEQFFIEHDYALLPILLGLELGDIDLFKKAIKEYFSSWMTALTELLTPFCADIPAAEALAQQSLLCIQGHLVSARIQKDPEALGNITNELRQLWACSSSIESHL